MFSVYCVVIKDFINFNMEFFVCVIIFDVCVDNFWEFFDWVVSFFGLIFDILCECLENYGGGWFDMCVDDCFWFVFGQFYGYNVILLGICVDFVNVIKECNFGLLWDWFQGQFKLVLKIQLVIIFNGVEDGWIMLIYFVMMGFYVLWVWLNIQEICDVLDWQDQNVFGIGFVFYVD